MPELPEVETVRRGLEPVLVGQKLTKVSMRRPDLRFPFPENFSKRLKGQTITALQRRAKYLLAHLSGGEVLVMHLGMSGRFTIVEPPKLSATSKSGIGPHPKIKERPGQFVTETAHNTKHDHVIFETAAGATVTYNDTRRFGYMLLVEGDDLHNHKMFCNLGPEPLGNELHADYLASVARGRKSDLKAFLMDQRIIAGLGNIYVCEALFHAGLSPDRKSATLTSKTGKPLVRTQALVASIRLVLNGAIAAGGSTLRDYKKTDGSLGYFQHKFVVYGREGEPCTKPRCKGVIARKIHSGRSTFFCPKCQK